MRRFTRRSEEEPSRVILECEECMYHVAFCAHVDCKLVLMDKLCALEDAVERFEELLDVRTRHDLNCEVNYVYRLAVHDHHGRM